MNEFVQQNWLALALVALVALFLVVWLIGRANRRPQVRTHRPDVLDEGVAPAARNQALIDSPMAMTIVPATAPSAAVTSPAAAREPVLPANAEAERWEAAERAEEPSADPPGDDLGRLKGVGPKLVTLLRSLGVARYAQIAGWSDADIDRIDAQLGPFQGRIRRDSWVEQARLLTDGDTAAYEAKFGKL